MGAAVVGAAIAGSAAVLLSDDETVRRQAALRVTSLQIDGDGADPGYATAARLPVVGAVTTSGATPATSGSPSCLEVIEGAPATLVRFPISAADRVEALGTRWATGQANLLLQPCPAR